MEENNLGLKYENRVVLFLDILGFRNHIFNSIHDKNTFNNICQVIEKINTYQDKFGKIPFREVTTFSDSIVISYPIDNMFLKRILHEIRDLVLILLEYDFVCRGGIGFGELYHKGSVVFGPAMAKAYELESKHAIFPRVIICNEDVVKYSLNHLECDIQEDEDGYYYFNIFNFYYSESGQMMYISQFLKSKLEKIINTNISNSDERIRDKYKWLSNKLTEGLKKKFYFVPIEENKAE